MLCDILLPIEVIFQEFCMSSEVLGPLFVDLMGESLAADEHRILKSAVVGGGDTVFTQLPLLAAVTIPDCIH